MCSCQTRSKRELDELMSEAATLQAPELKGSIRNVRGQSAKEAAAAAAVRARPVRMRTNTTTQVG